MAKMVSETTEGVSSVADKSPRKRRFTLTVQLPADFLKALGIDAPVSTPVKGALDTLVVNVKIGDATINGSAQEYTMPDAMIQVRLPTTFFPTPDGAALMLEVRGYWLTLTPSGDLARLVREVRERNEARGMISTRFCPECHVAFLPGRKDQQFDSRACKDKAAMRRLRQRDKQEQEAA